VFDRGVAWVAQSVKHPTLGFSSSPDLRVVRSSPESGSMPSLRFSLSPNHKRLLIIGNKLKVAEGGRGRG